MKFKWDKKYLYWGATALTVLLLTVLFNWLLQNSPIIAVAVKNVWKITSPIIDGIVIAFLLNPLVKWFETSVFPVFDKKVLDYRALPKWKQNLVRVLSVLLSYIVILLLLACFVISVIPQIKDSVLDIYDKFPQYKDNFLLWIENINKKYPEIEKFTTGLMEEYEESFENWKQTVLLPWIQNLATGLSKSVVNLFSAISDLIVGFIVSIYILSKKETFKGQFKKIIYSIFNVKNSNVIIKNTRMANDKFSGFLVGKIIDSLIIGIICYIGCLILKIDYPVLMAIVIGITNIIPFFGPIFGAIPTTILLLFINPLHALYFVIFIIILQLADGNVIGPKILGSSTGISSFWVIFAITLFGGFWGVPGMIIGVPLFAVIYSLIQSFLDIGLKNKQLASDTEKFMYLDYIDKDTKEFIEHKTVISDKKFIKFKRKNKKDNKSPKDNVDQTIKEVKDEKSNEKDSL